METQQHKKVLFICYSFSGQTRGLMLHMEKGLEESGISLTSERLETSAPLHFPFGSIRKTVVMMLLTFFRYRVPIKPLSQKCQDNYDLIILAGPTWSYNPSGPVLSLFDRDGATLFKNKTVIPLISCRGYWRMHWLGLKSLLKKHKARVPNRIIFTHPSKEPWRTIGVFLKLAGRSPETSKTIGKHYHKYGHIKEQQKEAFRFGSELGKALINNLPLENINFRTPPTGCNPD